MMHSLPARAAQLLFVTTITASLAAAAQEMPSRARDGAWPASIALRVPAAPFSEVRIAPSARDLLDAAMGERADPLSRALGIKRPAGPAAPKRVGSVFVAPAAQENVTWVQAGGPGKVAQLRVGSTGAKGIRAKLSLPAGLVLGEIRVAPAAGATGESVPLAAAREGEIWTPYTEGDTQVIEIHALQDVSAATVQVKDIVHFEESLNQAAVITKAAGACTVDVTCGSGDPFVDAALSERRRSVARMNYQSGGGSFLCSGTLINSAAQQDFFLTANHCMSTQAEASSLQLRWFYESATCGGGTAGAGGNFVTQSGGADMVFTNQFVDSTLLRLRTAPPGGTVYAGWNAAPLIPGSAIVSVSHPDGDVMKLATGSNTSLNRTDGLIRTSSYEQEMYAVLFNRGIIEGGSSGSGLFTLSGNSLQLRGVLSSSTTRNSPDGMTCANPNENANYGRFDYFQPQIAPLLNGTSYPANDDFPNQPAANAAAIALGTPVNATLSYLGDIDVFRIQVTQAGTLFVRSTGGFDLIGNLMDVTGNTLATNDDAFRGNNEFGIEWQVTPGTYYVAVAAWDPSVNTTTGYTLTASFIAQSQNRTALWWNANESGWGINFNHQGNTIFATMFNYESAGQGLTNPGMWLTATMAKSATGDSFTGQLLRVTGPAFNASPFTPIGAANVTAVGTMRVDFTGGNSATLTYDVAGAGTGGNGLPVVKSITRQAFGTLPACGFTGTDRSFEFVFQDLWWNKDESGWGINFTHQGNTIFATLFNYEPGVGTTNKGMWLTATLALSPDVNDGFTYRGDLLRVTGAAFNAVPFTPLDAARNVVKVGSMSVKFDHGNAGTLTYDVNGATVTKAIERQVFDPFRPVCEEP